MGGPGFGEVLSMAADMGRLLSCCAGRDRSSCHPYRCLGGQGGLSDGVAPSLETGS